MTSIVRAPYRTKRPEFRVCPVCGVEFSLHSFKDQRTCSSDCAMKAKRRAAAASDRRNACADPEETT